MRASGREREESGTRDKPSWAKPVSRLKVHRDVDHRSFLVGSRLSPPRRALRLGREKR